MLNNPPTYHHCINLVDLSWISQTNLFSHLFLHNPIKTMSTPNKLQNYRINCTLSFGDIYAQIMIWLIVIFISLATAFALWSSTRQIYALATVGLVLVLSLPFLLFAFVTTLLNHIEITPTDISTATSTTMENVAQLPAQVAS